MSKLLLFLAHPVYQSLDKDHAELTHTQMRQYYVTVISHQTISQTLFREIAAKTQKFKFQYDAEINCPLKYKTCQINTNFILKHIFLVNCIKNKSRNFDLVRKILSSMMQGLIFDPQELMTQGGLSQTLLVYNIGLDIFI